MNTTNTTNMMKAKNVQILKKSILDQDVDAIVNPGNPRLAHGGGLCGIIYDAVLKKSKEGYRKMMDDIEALPDQEDVDGDFVKCPPGYVTYTDIKEVGLKAPYIFHTVGANVYDHKKKQQDEIIERCYQNCFRVAKNLGLNSIALPLVSAGLYGCKVKTVYCAFVKAYLRFTREIDPEKTLDIRLCMVEQDKYDEIMSYCVDEGSESGQGV